MKKVKLDDNVYWMILVILFLGSVMFFAYRDTQQKLIANRAETLKNRELGVKNYKLLLEIRSEVTKK